MLSQRLKRETISARAQSRYNAQRNRRYIGFLAESLTRKDIREMHLDDRQGDSGQRVSQRRHARLPDELVRKIIETAGPYCVLVKGGQACSLEIPRTAGRTRRTPSQQPFAPL